MWCSEVSQILLQAQHQLRQQLFNAEFPTLNETETQAVKIVSQSPWHLCQAGSLTLINARGERVLQCYDETVGSGLRVLEDDQIPARSSEK